jgi:hypothetical protein
MTPAPRPPTPPLSTLSLECSHQREAAAPTLLSTTILPERRLRTHPALSPPAQGLRTTSPDNGTPLLSRRREALANPAPLLLVWDHSWILCSHGSCVPRESTMRNRVGQSIEQINKTRASLPGTPLASIAGEWNSKGSSISSECLVLICNIFDYWVRFDSEFVSCSSLRLWES